MMVVMVVDGNRTLFFFPCFLPYFPPFFPSILPSFLPYYFFPSHVCLLYTWILSPLPSTSHHQSLISPHLPSHSPHLPSPHLTSPHLVSPSHLRKHYRISFTHTRPSSSSSPPQPPPRLAPPVAAATCKEGGGEEEASLSLSFSLYLSLYLDYLTCY